MWLLLVIFRQLASLLFRSAAVVGRSMTNAFVVGSFIMLVLFALGGFLLSRGIATKMKNVMEGSILFFTPQPFLL